MYILWYGMIHRIPLGIVRSGVLGLLSGHPWNGKFVLPELDIDS